MSALFKLRLAVFMLLFFRVVFPFTSVDLTDSAGAVIQDANGQDVKILLTDTGQYIIFADVGYYADDGANAGITDTMDDGTTPAFKVVSKNPFKDGEIEWLKTPLPPSDQLSQFTRVSTIPLPGTMNTNLLTQPARRVPRVNPAVGAKQPPRVPQVAINAALIKQAPKVPGQAQPNSITMRNLNSTKQLEKSVPPTPTPAVGTGGGVPLAPVPVTTAPATAAKKSWWWPF